MIPQIIVQGRINFQRTDLTYSKVKNKWIHRVAEASVGGDGYYGAQYTAGKGQSPTARPAHTAREEARGKVRKARGLPAPAGLATAQGSYEGGMPGRPKHPPDLLSSGRALARPSTPGVAWLLHSGPAGSHLHISGAVPFSSSVPGPPQSPAVMAPGRER